MTQMGGLSFYEDTEGNKYAVGADAVPKKLGSIEYTETQQSSSNNANISMKAENDYSLVVMSMSANNNTYTITINGVDKSESLLATSTGSIALLQHDIKAGDVIKITRSYVYGLQYCALIK